MRARGLGLAVLALVLGGTSVASQTASFRARQGMLSLDDARIFYEVLGTGDPIIVVHGGPGLDHQYLRPGLDVLAVRHTLVYYDQRGTGRSTAALDTTTINIDAFVDDIDALRQALGLERVTVLGHSFGSLIALEYAERYPDDVRALILMNPVEPGTRFEEQTAVRAAASRTEADSVELRDLTSSEGYAARDPATLSQVYRVLFRQTLKNRDRIGELSLDLMPSTAKNGPEVEALLGSSMTLDQWDRLPRIDTPTLVIHGRYDVIPVEMSSALAEALPRGSLAVLDSGHFPFLEDANGLLAAVSSFFAGLPR